MSATCSSPVRGDGVEDVDTPGFQLREERFLESVFFRCSDLVIASRDGSQPCQLQRTRALLTSKEKEGTTFMKCTLTPAARRRSTVLMSEGSNV